MNAWIQQMKIVLPKNASTPRMMTQMWGMRVWLVLALLCAGCLRHARDAFFLNGEVKDFPSALYQSVGAHLEPGHRLDLEENSKVFDAIRVCSLRPRKHGRTGTRLAASAST